MSAVEARSSAAMAPVTSSSGPNLPETRYNTPPQHVSELGVISCPYERIGHHGNLPALASPDQQEGRSTASPGQVGHSHHPSNARPLAFRNPYIRRADEIGLYHGITGLGHLGLDLVPPEPWKAGDDPVNPEDALFLFEQSRQRARAEHERLNIDGMSGEEKVKSHGLWLRELRKHELIRDHRIDIWNRFIEGGEALSQHQNRQYQPSFGPTPHLGYNQKPLRYFHPQGDSSAGALHGQTTNSNRYQIAGSPGDLPSPSGLDPYLIRQSVESAVDRFRYQQTQVELSRLQSERQLGDMLNHFRDHIEQTPPESHGGGTTVLVEGGHAPKGLVSVPTATTTSAVPTPSSGPPARSRVPGGLGVIQHPGPCTLPPPRIALDHSPSAVESGGIADGSPVRSVSNDKSTHVHRTIRDPLFGVTAYPQLIGHRDPLPPIRDALQPSFVSPGYPTASYWAQQAGNAVGAVGTLGIGGSDARSYQGESPQGGEKAEISKPEKPAGMVPRKKKEKKEVWNNQFIQNTDYPYTKEDMEIAVVDSQIMRVVKPRARRRKAPTKFDEKKGFPITQSMASNLLESGLIRARYANTKSDNGSGSLPGGLGLANDTLTTAGEIRQSSLPKTGLFSTALPQPMSSVRLVGTPVLTPNPPNTYSHPISSISHAEGSSSELSSPPNELSTDGTEIAQTPTHESEQDGDGRLPDDIPRG